jgi:hypothetical protein
MESKEAAAPSNSRNPVHQVAHDAFRSRAGAGLCPGADLEFRAGTLDGCGGSALEKFRGTVFTCRQPLFSRPTRGNRRSGDSSRNPSARNTSRTHAQPGHTLTDHPPVHSRCRRASTWTCCVPRLSGGAAIGRRRASGGIGWERCEAAIGRPSGWAAIGWRGGVGAALGLERGGDRGDSSGRRRLVGRAGSDRAASSDRALWPSMGNV